MVLQILFQINPHVIDAESHQHNNKMHRYGKPEDIPKRIMQAIDKLFAGRFHLRCHAPCAAQVNQRINFVGKVFDFIRASHGQSQNGQADGGNGIIQLGQLRRLCGLPCGKR